LFLTIQSSFFEDFTKGGISYINTMRMRKIKKGKTKKKRAVGHQPTARNNRDTMIENY